MTVVVKVEVEDLGLVVKVVARLLRGSGCENVWCCFSGKIHFLWCLSLLLVEGKTSNVCGRLFGMVMWADFLRLLFFLNSDCLGKMACAKMEIEVVVEMVLGVVAMVV